jgi:DNA-binding IclR family transcriptional regulator
VHLSRSGGHETSWLVSDEKVLEAMKREPQTFWSLPAIVRATGQSEATVRATLDRLLRSGEVRVTSDGQLFTVQGLP